METRANSEAPFDVQIQIKELLDKIPEIDRRLERIENLLQTLLRDVEGVHTSTKNMDDHITFVNGVYTQIHRPFHALMNAAGQIIGSRDNSLEHEEPPSDQNSVLTVVAVRNGIIDTNRYAV